MVRNVFKGARSSEQETVYKILGVIQIQTQDFYRAAWNADAV